MRKKNNKKPTDIHSYGHSHGQKMVAWMGNRWGPDEITRELNEVKKGRWKTFIIIPLIIKWKSKLMVRSHRPQRQKLHDDM